MFPIIIFCLNRVNISPTLLVMVYKAYFSPTGGTKKCLDILVPEEKGNIDLAKKDYEEDHVLCKNDILYVALPAFGGRCPSLAIERLKRIKGDGTKAVIIIVYGNRAYEDSLIELYDSVKAQGFIICAAVTAVAEHSMIKEIAEGRPDERDKTELKSFRGKIAERLKENKEVENIPGKRPYKPLSKFLPPSTDSTCIRCGQCYLACPADAIDQMRPDITDENKCIGCARCISICPINARGYDKDRLNGVKERIAKQCEKRKDNELFM